MVCVNKSASTMDLKFLYSLFSMRLNDSRLVNSTDLSIYVFLTYYSIWYDDIDAFLTSYYIWYNIYIL